MILALIKKKKWHVYILIKFSVWSLDLC